MSEQMNELNRIRLAEASSHTEVYSKHELYTSGSWLAKPVKTVLDILPLYRACNTFCGLDLGCGVGRNSIPVAQAFSDIPCRLDCVDILGLAIEKLQANAQKYHVSHAIRGIVSSIDDFPIKENHYDLILAISALEHTNSKDAFIQKLMQIQTGIRPGGTVCLIMNSGVLEQDKETKKQLPPQFEVNLQTSELQCILQDVFQD